MNALGPRLLHLTGPLMRTRLVTLALVLVLVAASIVLGIMATRLTLRAAENGTIRQLQAGFDVPVAETSGPRLLFARAHFLLVRDRLDEARPLVDRLAETDPDRLGTAALYDLANARLEAALDLLGQSKFDPAIPQVRLAKEAYRRALVLDPEFWDAKYNLDVAMRLVRDFPQIESEPEEPPPGAKKRPWTDLPGLPKGLP